MARRRGILRRAARLLGRALIWAAGLAMLWALAYRWIGPPTTMLIEGERARLGSVAREWRDLDALSPNLVRAVIAAEDAQFCAHGGFDLNAIRAAWRRISAGGALRGGSTITQQTAKNVFLWPARSWLRKGLEVPFSMLIELLWGKRRIVEVYLNVVEMGEGVFGAQEAARRAFGRDADALTPLQAARLAAILPNPRGRSAAKPATDTARRARRILHGMETVRAQGLDSCVAR